MDKSDLYGAVAATGKALSHGARLEVLELLAQGERSVRELAAATGLKLSTASAHLQVLRHAGLVSVRTEATRVFYRLAGEDVATLMSLLNRVAQAHRAEVQAVRRSYLGDQGIRMVGRDELLDEVAAGRAMVLDVRPAGEYAAGHIPGAVCIPVEQLAERLAELPPDAEVVAYCRGTNCVLSFDAVRLLIAEGRSAALLEDGFLEWRAEGLPVSA